MTYIVYGLFTRGDADTKNYFYVGKTRRPIDLRMREHLKFDRGAVARHVMLKNSRLFPRQARQPDARSVKGASLQVAEHCTRSIKANGVIPDFVAVYVTSSCDVPAKKAHGRGVRLAPLR